MDMQLYIQGLIQRLKFPFTMLQIALRIQIDLSLITFHAQINLNKRDHEKSEIMVDAVGAEKISEKSRLNARINKFEVQYGSGTGSRTAVSIV